MALRNQQKQLVEKHKFSENSTTVTEIPLDNMIRRMVLFFSISIAAGATAPSNPKRNDFLNLIKKMRLVLEGDENKFNLDAVTKYYVDYYELGEYPLKSSLPTLTANQTRTLHYVAVFDFATARKLIKDYTALLDNSRYSSMHLEIDWGDIDDIYSTKGTASIQAATECQISLIEAYEDGNTIEGVPNDSQEFRNSLLDIREGTLETQVDRAYNSYDDDALEVDVAPAASRIMSQMLFARENVTDGNATFVNDVISQVKLLNTRGPTRTFLQNYFTHLRAQNKTDYNLAALPNGMIYLDWLDDRQRGLDNRNADELVFRFLTKAPASGKKNGIRVYTKHVPN